MTAAAELPKPVAWQCLLPCPFCGRQPRWSHSPRETHMFGNEVPRVYEWHSCLQCCAVHFSGFGYVRDDGGNALAHQRAMRIAAERWNERHANTQLAAIRAELEAAQRDLLEYKIAATGLSNRQEAELEALRDAADGLLLSAETVIEHANASDEHLRGTLGTDFVRHLLRDEIAAYKAQRAADKAHSE